MSELNNNGKMAVKNEEKSRNYALSELNQVEGFHPEDYLINVSDAGDDIPKYYLPVQARKLWFRLKYPSGKIETKIERLEIVSGQPFAIVEAKVYLESGDDDYIANAFGCRKYDESNKYGQRFIEWAETGAVGRALGTIGFGSQFVENDDIGDDFIEPDEVDSPINGNPITNKSMEPQVETETKANQEPPSTATQAETETKANQEPPSMATQAETETEANQEPPSTATQTGTETEANQEPPLTTTQTEIESNTDQENPSTEIQATSGSEDTITNVVIPSNDMTIEEIERYMTLEFALNYPASIKATNQPLGIIYKTNTKLFHFLTTYYVGTDNVMKVAANFIQENMPQAEKAS